MRLWNHIIFFLQQPELSYGEGELWKFPCLKWMPLCWSKLKGIVSSVCGTKSGGNVEYPGTFDLWTIMHTRIEVIYTKEERSVPTGYWCINKLIRCLQMKDVHWPQSLAAHSTRHQQHWDTMWMMPFTHLYVRSV